MLPMVVVYFKTWHPALSLPNKKAVTRKHFFIGMFIQWQKATIGLKRIIGGIILKLACCWWYGCLQQQGCILACFLAKLFNNLLSAKYYLASNMGVSVVWQKLPTTSQIRHISITVDYWLFFVTSSGNLWHRRLRRTLVLLKLYWAVRRQ